MQTFGTHLRPKKSEPQEVAQPWVSANPLGNWGIGQSLKNNALLKSRPVHRNFLSIYTLHIVFSISQNYVVTNPIIGQDLFERNSVPGPIWENISL